MTTLSGSSGVVVVVVGGVVVVVVDGGVVVVVDGGVVVVVVVVDVDGCSGGPMVPDSVVSSGPEQSGSSTSVSASASSSASFEHWGRDGASTPLCPPPPASPPPWAPAVPATTHAARTASPIISRSFRLIPSCFALGTGPRPASAPAHAQWLTLSS